MGRAIGVVWQGIRDLYDDLFPFVGMNLIWFIPTSILFYVAWQILALVVVGVSSFGQETPAENVLSVQYYSVGVFLGTLFLYMPNPFAAGVHYYANRKVNDERVEFGLVWEGIRLFWKRATWLFLISLGGVALLFVNIVFYFSRGEQLFGVIGFIFGWVLFIWLMMQMYMLPLLMEQESKSIRLVLRNAAVLTLANPGFTIPLMIFVVILAVLSVGITILAVLLGGALIAMIEQHAVVTLLERYRSQRQS